MKLRAYVLSKAVTLCVLSVAAVLWGLFAYLTGAHPVLLWGSEIVFVVTVVLRYTLGYLLTRAKLQKLQRQADNLSEKYLLGELLPVPYDAVERAYFTVMKEISRAAVGEIEKAGREKEDYFAAVEKWIHEIKTPLTACSLICDNGGDPVKLRRELKKADNCTDVILQYARLRSAENDTHIANVRIADVINNAVKGQHELLTAAKIGVSVDGDFGVYTDAKAFGFIIKQLLINCAKYCPSCHIAVTAQAGRVTVADNGPGIAAHELPRITERGYTGGGHCAGTGMGLYIVSELCKRLDITLTVQSRPGEGTQFTFTFPAA